MKKNIYLISIILFFTFSACNDLTVTRIIRLGHGLSTSHSVHKGMVHFGKKLEELSKGDLRFKYTQVSSLELKDNVLNFFKLEV